MQITVAKACSGFIWSRRSKSGFRILPKRRWLPDGANKRRRGRVYSVASRMVSLLARGLDKLWAFRSRNNAVQHQPAPEFSKRSFRLCGTMLLQNGGTLIAKTGSMVDIITKDSTETMTVDEYNARQISAKANHDI
jgi:hypothetical protein